MRPSAAGQLLSSGDEALEVEKEYRLNLQAQTDAREEVSLVLRGRRESDGVSSNRARVAA